jgi:hypothetical protein
MFSVLMAIVADDFTLGYFKVVYDLVVPSAFKEIIQETIPNELQSSATSKLIHEVNRDDLDTDWKTTTTSATWD